MANLKAEGKRKRKRKSRTEASPSPSISSSSSDSETPDVRTQPSKPKIIETSTQKAKSPSESVDSTPSPTSETPAEPKFTTDEAFEAFYLRQATKEFAEDLNKLRSASDFREGSSLALLISGLKQGTACFGQDERRKIASGKTAA